MILASLELENYKQYSGCHRIDFPEQGMVAITGPNGAGKTTLFEAIEWCLYGPRTIALGTIPPHDGVGATRVRVILHDPGDDRRYVVQRELRQGSTQAEVYHEDQPGQSIVQGPRDVTEYVSRQLIGLSHGAFVSTFFTRQKELTFFGDRPPGERRTEVARLLGFQTIRDAQEELATERTAARRDAMSLRDLYERDAAGRDFPAEIAAAKGAVAATQEAAAAGLQRLAEADAAYARSRDDLDRWRTLQEQDAACERELLTTAGATQAASSRRHAAEAELHRLDALAAERTGLAAEAAHEDERVLVVDAMERERERARRLDTLEQTVATNGGQLARVADELRALVAQHQDAAAGRPGWCWREEDGADPAQAVARVRQAVIDVDDRTARARAETLQRAFDLAARSETAQKKLEQYRTFRDDLALQWRRLVGETDPSVTLAAAEETVTRARATLEGALSALTEARRESRESEELEKIFDKRSFNRRCPTCTRPLSDDEAARLVRTLRGATARLRDDEAAREQDATAAREALAAAESARAYAADVVQQAKAFKQRLADGEQLIASLETESARDLDELRALLARVGLDRPPLPPEIAAALAAAEQAAQFASLRGTLDQFEQRARIAGDSLGEAEREIAALGAVAYDPDAHRVAMRALEAARYAAAEVKRIDIELRGRDAYAATKQAAERELRELEQRTRDLERARGAIGFDAEALGAARLAEAQATAAQQVARDAAGAAREALRDAEAALRRVVEDQERLQRLAAEADRRGRDADELDRMYREFAEFDKYVADHVGPLLAETTERLLSQVTEGKFDRVRFDENYGIEVFDGDECFRLDAFSGGERDVVALCARLAMSELVGSAAVRPPRFLVLDEVFGSLDSERRAQLLETLGTLASGGHFQQMFIISHVDDVQQSPVMSEAWTIEERDGVSRVNRPEVLWATSA